MEKKLFTTTKLTETFKNSNEFIKLYQIPIILFVIMQFVVGELGRFDDSEILKQGIVLLVTTIDTFVVLIIIALIHNRRNGVTETINVIFNQLFKKLGSILVVIGIDYLFITIAIQINQTMLLYLVLVFLFVFKWQIFMLDGKRALKVFSESFKTVLVNQRDILKYALSFVGAQILMFFLLSTLGSSEGAVATIVLLCFHFLGKVVFTYSVVVFTYVFIEYKEGLVEDELLQ